MRTNDMPLQFLQPEKLTGKTPSGIVRWVENFMTLVRPNNGIEWVSTIHDDQEQRPLRQIVKELAERAKTRVYDVRPAVYVLHGHIEGLRIMVDLVAGAQREQLIHIKTFGKIDESWGLAAKLSIVLELVLLHGEEPVIVDAVNLLAIKRHGKRETLAVSYGDQVTLQVGEGLDRQLKFPLHQDPEINKLQRAAIQHDVAIVVEAFNLSLGEPAHHKEQAFSVAGVAFAAVRCFKPRPHWRLKIIETGEILIPGAGVISNESVPKMKADIEAYFERCGKSLVSFRQGFGLLRCAQACPASRIMPRERHELIREDGTLRYVIFMKAAGRRPAAIGISFRVPGLPRLTTTFTVEGREFDLVYEVAVN